MIDIKMPLYKFGVGINNCVNYITSKLILEENELKTIEDYDLVTSVEVARKDWEDAKKYFQTVSDPDLVDHAIYMLEASQKKYIYLIKKAKKEGARVELP